MHGWDVCSLKSVWWEFLNETVDAIGIQTKVYNEKVILDQVAGDVLLTKL